MVFNKSLAPPPLSKLYQIQNVIQTNSHQLCKGRGGGVSVPHCIDYICVMPSLLYGRNIFLSVLTFLQMLV